MIFHKINLFLEKSFFLILACGVFILSSSCKTVDSNAKSDLSDHVYKSIALISTPPPKYLNSFFFNPLRNRDGAVLRRAFRTGDAPAAAFEGRVARFCALPTGMKRRNRCRDAERPFRLTVRRPTCRCAHGWRWAKPERRCACPGWVGNERVPAGLG